MSSSNTGDIVFTGANAQECERFIQSVKRKALLAGKQRDDAWIADFASTCFGGQALLWLESQDLEIQQNWSRLRPALLARYCGGTFSPPTSPSFTSSGEGSSVVLRSTAAANRAGRIKIVGEDRSSSGYIARSLGMTGRLWRTPNESQALHVAFTSGMVGLQNLRVLNLDHPGYMWLGAKWNMGESKSVVLGRGSNMWAPLAAVSAGEGSSVKASVFSAGPVRTTIWSVNSDMSLIPIWEDSGSAHALLPFIGEFDRVHLACDYSACEARDDKDFSKVRLVIEEVSATIPAEPSTQDFLLRKCRIKITSSDWACRGYVCKTRGMWGNIYHTSDRHDAMVVSFNPGSGLVDLKPTNFTDGRYDRLGIAWGEQPVFGRGSAMIAEICGISGSEDSKQVASSYMSGPVSATVWQVGKDNSVKVKWKDGYRTYDVSCIMHKKMSWLYATPDVSAARASEGGYNYAEVAFVLEDA